MKGTPGQTSSVTEVSASTARIGSATVTFPWGPAGASSLCYLVDNLDQELILYCNDNDVIQAWCQTCLYSSL